MAQCAERGITPAYAGNTWIKSKIEAEDLDHPRLRGEHIGILWLEELDQGSPPPTRGTLNNAYAAQEKKGITPAYAGNTPYGTIHKE